MGKTYVGATVRRTAKEVKRYRTWLRIIPVTIAILLLLMILTYVCSALYKNTGAFTIAINPGDKVVFALSLSETPDFKVRTSQLNAEIDEFVTNISSQSVPKDLDDPSRYTGEHNGPNYVAYTFFLRNEGDKSIVYAMETFITNATQRLDDSIRIRIYSDGVVNDYAKPLPNGTAKSGTTAFVTDTTVVREDVYDFKPGDVHRYTVVMWVEGEDTDDGMIGGELRIDMGFDVIKQYEGEGGIPVDVDPGDSSTEAGPIEDYELEPWMIVVEIILALLAALAAVLAVKKRRKSFD